MTAASLDDALIMTPVGDVDFDWQVPDGWQQDRGAWGGLVVAAIVRAAGLRDPDREVRTVSAQIPAPVPTGISRVKVRPVKEGSALSVWSVEVSDPDQGTIWARGTVLTGRPRVPELPMDDWGTATMPSAPPWADVPILPVQPPIGPVFTQHVEYRLIEGMPFTSTAARALGYVNMREPSLRDAAMLLGLVDAWWPSCYSALASPRPAVTVSFEAHLLVDPALVTDEPLLFSSEVLAARDGYTTERRSLWAPDGRLVVENLQSIVVIR